MQSNVVVRRRWNRRWSSRKTNNFSFFLPHASWFLRASMLVPQHYFHHHHHRVTSLFRFYCWCNSNAHRLMASPFFFSQKKSAAMKHLPTAKKASRKLWRRKRQTILPLLFFATIFYWNMFSYLPLCFWCNQFSVIFESSIHTATHIGVCFLSVTKFTKGSLFSFA